MEGKYISLSESTAEVNQYFFLNASTTEISVNWVCFFLQCWIEMSNQHDSIIGEEIKQHAEYQQVIYEILQIANAISTCGKWEQTRA